MTHKRKTGAAVLLITAFILLINIQGAFSEEGAAVADNRHQGQIGSSLKMQEEIRDLQDKVGRLEKTVADQAALIDQQRQVLDKLIQNVPEVKVALTPPEPKTLVKQFVVNGANLFTAKDFEVVLNKYRDKELGMTDLKKAADEITGLYRKKGYIVTLAYVPAQEITNNTVEFNVVEGRVGDIQIEKPKYSKVETIQKKFLVEKGQILDSKQLEVNLRRINKQPDRTIRAVLSPGPTPETSNILLKLDKERSPQHFYTEFNNRGTKYTHKQRWGLGYINNNLLGNDDILSLRFLANSKTDVYSASAAYEFPISRYNTRLGAYAAYSKADVGGQFSVPGLDVQGNATFWGLYVSHPWLDKQFFDEPTNTSLALTGTLIAGFDSISVHNQLLPGHRNDDHDELRVFKAGINFEETDNLGRGAFTAEFHAGIPDFLGSMSEHEVTASRMDSGAEFQKYTGTITRITRLPVSSALVNNFRYQYTNYALVNAEQMAIGGADTVRGFPENEYLADYGWINTVELRVPAFFLPPILKVPFDKKRTPLVDAIQLVGFIDAGKGYINKARVGETRTKYLVGGGFGFRFDFYEHLRGRIDVGFPGGNERPSDGSTSTVHFGLQYEW